LSAKNNFAISKGKIATFKYLAGRQKLELHKLLATLEVSNTDSITMCLLVDKKEKINKYRQERGRVRRKT
jgi:hypothetical protein